MKPRLLAAALLAPLLFSTACTGQTKKSSNKNMGYQRTSTGLEYRIVKDDKKSTTTPKTGDFVEIHIRHRVGDSVLFSSRQLNNNQAVQLQLTPPAYPGDVVEGIALMTAGDSAVFRVPVDSMLKLGVQPMPWMKPGTGQKMDMEVVLVSVRTPAQMQSDQASAAAKQMTTDDKIIQDYLTKNNIKAAKTASGLYYRIDNPGSGAAVKTGDKITMNYTGKTLDGKTFDSNVDPAFSHVQPFEFMLGMGQVIKGWDEGIALFKPGGKGVLYIPSPLAYGAQSPTPAIAPNSVLIFDVEMVKAEASSK